MKLHWPILCVLLESFTVLALPAAGQTDEEETFLENREEYDATGWMELFENVRMDPMDLNREPLETLQAFPLISPEFARRIVKERKSGGPFQSWEDFGRRMQLNESFARQLTPYFNLSVPRDRVIKRMETRLRAVHSFPEPEGYRTGDYPGNPLHAYMRIKAAWGDRLSTGLLVEKDPGETDWCDHTVGFVDIRNVFQDGRILVGNFLADAGQGLVFSTPYGAVKGTDPFSPVKKRALDGRGYLYAAEQKAFQGLFIEKRFGRYHGYGFVSKTRLDGTVHSDGSISGIGSDGLHRTESEKKRCHALAETVFGIRFCGSYTFGTIGLSGYSGRYSKPVVQEDLERSRFEFTGSRNHAFGMDWDLNWKNHGWSGEAALSRSKGLAMVSTWMAEWKRTDWLVVFRNYDPDFHNPRAAGFSAGENRNERGVYWGGSGKLSAHSTLGIYFDLFNRPWRTYFVPIPTRGEDLFFRFDKNFPGLFSLMINTRFRLSEKMTLGETPDGRETDCLVERMERLVRLELSCRPFRPMESKTRFGCVRVRYPGSNTPVRAAEQIENGFLFSQTIRFQDSERFRLSARWSAFDTDSYDSRLYSYENDLDGVFSAPFFYEKGTRWYMLLRWHPIRCLVFSAKFSRTLHRGVSSWGSGPDEIEGNAVNRIGVQIDWID